MYRVRLQDVIEATLSSSCTTTVMNGRDARLPFSSVNPHLEEVIRNKRGRIIVLNKADLASQADRRVLFGYIFVSINVQYQYAGSTNVRL